MECGDQGSWQEAGSLEIIGDGLEGMMKEVTDVTGGKAGFQADIAVGTLLFELESKDFPAAGVQLTEALADLVEAFLVGNLQIGCGMGIHQSVG